MHTLSHLALAAFTLAGVAAVAGPAPEAPAKADKSRYHLFNPTPRELMREMVTDRPDATEAAYTVDAGHVQVEVDLAKFTSDRHSSDGTRAEEWNLGAVNLKLGLFNNVDLQIVLDNYVEQRTREPGAGTRTPSGFGDITARLKINLWGNDGGPTALAIMPFVKLPLSESSLRNGETEGGIIIPFALDFTERCGIGVMTEVDFVSDEHGGHDVEWVNSITLGYDFTDRVGGYVEFFSVVGNAPGFDWQGQVDVGFTYAVTADVQLDLGCNFGVTRSAPDYQPFLGLSIRF
jgi:hypothetical protein